MSADTLQVILTAVCTGASTWAVMRLEIKFLWRDLARLEQRIEKLEAVL